MVCYNTCSYPGCYERIPYNKGEVPEKYCEKHNHGRNRSNLVSDPHHLTTDEKQPPDIPKVILRCPICKQRYEVPKADWEKGKGTTHCICGEKLLYHKDK